MDYSWLKIRSPGSPVPPGFPHRVGPLAALLAAGAAAPSGDGGGLPRERMAVLVEYHSCSCHVAMYYMHGCTNWNSHTSGALARTVPRLIYSRGGAQPKSPAAGRLLRAFRQTPPLQAAPDATAAIAALRAERTARASLPNSALLSAGG